MSAPTPPTRRVRQVLILLGVAAVVLLTQQALAAQLGGWLAGVWVATVELVLRLIAPLFGG